MFKGANGRRQKPIYLIMVVIFLATTFIGPIVPCEFFSQHWDPAHEVVWDRAVIRATLADDREIDDNQPKQISAPALPGS